MSPAYKLLNKITGDISKFTRYPAPKNTAQFNAVKVAKKGLEKELISFSDADGNKLRTDIFENGKLQFKRMYTTFKKDDYTFKKMELVDMKISDDSSPARKPQIILQRIFKAKQNYFIVDTLRNTIKKVKNTGWRGAKIDYDCSLQNARHNWADNVPRIRKISMNFSYDSALVKIENREIKLDPDTKYFAKTLFDTPIEKEPFLSYKLLAPEARVQAFTHFFLRKKGLKNLNIPTQTNAIKHSDLAGEFDLLRWKINYEKGMPTIGTIGHEAEHAYQNAMIARLPERTVVDRSLRKALGPKLSDPKQLKEARAYKEADAIYPTREQRLENKSLYSTNLLEEKANEAGAAAQKFYDRLHEKNETAFSEIFYNFEDFI